jgi:putative ABC transport system permease protein
MSQLPLRYSIRNLRARWQVCALAVFGVSLAAAALVALTAMAMGVRTTLRRTGRADNAIVVQKGTRSEMTSDVSREHVGRISVEPMVARAGDRVQASPEIVVMTNLPRRGDGGTMNVLLRGVTPAAFKVRGGLSLRDGQWFRPGVAQAIVGVRIHDRVAGVQIGDRLRLQGANLEVVGVFASEGNGFESEIWADADVVAGAFGRSGFQSLTVRLTDPGLIPDFVRAVERDSQSQLEAKGEQEYYDEQAGPLVMVMAALTGLVCLVMGMGAALGAMNTMYATVASRTREIGTLRALGFARRTVLLSFVLESTLLGLAGGGLGCLLALPVDGLTAATQGGSFTDLSFYFQITGPALGGGVLFGALVGFAGGLLPALRAARMPIVAALREAA